MVGVLSSCNPEDGFSRREEGYLEMHPLILTQRVHHLDQHIRLWYITTTYAQKPPLDVHTDV